jgi:hypothetical protein
MWRQSLPRKTEFRRLLGELFSEKGNLWQNIPFSENCVAFWRSFAQKKKRLHPRPNVRPSCCDRFLGFLVMLSSWYSLNLWRKYPNVLEPTRPVRHNMYQRQYNHVNLQTQFHRLSLQARRYIRPAPLEHCPAPFLGLTVRACGEPCGSAPGFDFFSG